MEDPHSHSGEEIRSLLGNSHLYGGGGVGSILFGVRYSLLGRSQPLRGWGEGYTARKGPLMISCGSSLLYIQS